MKTKIFILAILLAAGLHSSRAQELGTWTQKADFGGTVRVGATGFSIGSKGYIGTGLDQPSQRLYQDFWEYTPSPDPGNPGTWTQKADFGGTARWLAVGFSIGHMGYIATGDAVGGPTKDFWEYDPFLNIWRQKADFGGTARFAAVGFSIISKGYIGTGNDGSDREDFWEYTPDPGNPGTWTRKADFGGGPRDVAVGFSILSQGYIGTGGHPPNNYKDFWEYDPSFDTWRQRADFGGTARTDAVGFSIGHKGYLGTGFDNDSGERKDFWEYDPNFDTWRQKADFGGTARIDAVGFSIGTKGYIGTGNAFRNVTSKDFWEYTPEAPSFYRDVILNDNPIMYWRLGETSGTIAYDETANNRDATYIHHPSLGFPGAIANDTNTSVSFMYGCNQGVEWIPTSRYSFAFTVEAWVKEKQIRPVETFFSTRTKRAEFSFDFKLDTLAGKEIHFDVGDGVQWLSTSSLPFNFQPDVWYYVAAVVTTGGATYYVDGAALGSVTYRGIPLLFDATHTVQIGTNIRYDSEWFDGAIDEVAVYPYALTAEQIAAHYAIGTGN